MSHVQSAGSAVHPSSYRAHCPRRYLMAPKSPPAAVDRKDHNTVSFQAFRTPSAPPAPAAWRPAKPADRERSTRAVMGSDHCSKPLRKSRTLAFPVYASPLRLIPQTNTLPSCPPFLLPSCPLSHVSWLLAFRFLELIAPAEDTGLGAVVLGLSLITALHPDAGHRGVDVDVLRTKRQGLFAGG